MEQTKSTKILFTDELAPLLKPLKDLVPSVRPEALPSLKEMLDSDPPRYPYSKSFDEARNDPIVILHSSGSTGE
jgi:acyl-coenzyme A synthetase/AMP-(fatty) acid ligase